MLTSWPIWVDKKNSINTPIKIVPYLLRIQRWTKDMWNTEKNLEYYCWFSKAIISFQIRHKQAFISYRDTIWLIEVWMCSRKIFTLNETRFRDIIFISALIALRFTEIHLVYSNRNPLLIAAFIEVRNNKHKFRSKQWTFSSWNWC